MTLAIYCTVSASIGFAWGYLTGFVMDALEDTAAVSRFVIYQSLMAEDWLR